MVTATLRTHVTTTALLTFALVTGLPGCGGAAGESGRPAAPPVTQEPAPKPTVAYDHGLTDQARVIAGMDPEDVQRFAPVIARASWKAHKKEFDANWAQVEQQRFGLMREWRNKEFKAIADGCDTLFYPFGGPDFLNAYLIYPSCKTYLLFGLESVGSIPAIEKMKDDKIDAELAQLFEALSDIFKRDYFITKTMQSELRTAEVDGTLPVILTFLARLDAKIVRIETDGPWNRPAAAAPAAAAGTDPAGTIRPRSGRLPSVTVSFVGPNSDRIQQVTYIRVDMMNPAYSTRTQLLNYLKGLGPLTTFVKSASYLMHDDRFSLVRSTVLEQSSSLLQDDTGVPYRFFDAAKWNLTFYGKYSAPIKDFNYGFQKDLDAVYQRPGVARELPFSFGYHWHEGTSSVMLAVRKTGSL
ncbi:MAG: hypothetical protein NTV05_04625 [Acidobacteria bacterium]|nr:hypothetical protein [Acidobacteriota bacterium]